MPVDKASKPMRNKRKATAVRIRIRRAAPDDSPSIATVLYKSFEGYKSSYTEEAFVATTPTSEELRHRMVEGLTWVAVEDKALVGTVSAVPNGAALYIRSMAVIPSARGRGIGESLLHHVQNFAKANRYRRLFLSTTPFLISAIRLYQRFGFRRSREGPQDLFGTPLFTMGKKLKASRG